MFCLSSDSVSQGEQSPTCKTIFGSLLEKLWWEGCKLALSPCSSSSKGGRGEVRNLSEGSGHLVSGHTHQFDHAEHAGEDRSEKFGVGVSLQWGPYGASGAPPPAANFPWCQGTLHQVEHPVLLIPCRGGPGGCVNARVASDKLRMV